MKLDVFYLSKGWLGSYLEGAMHAHSLRGRNTDNNIYNESFKADLKGEALI